MKRIHPFDRGLAPCPTTNIRTTFRTKMILAAIGFLCVLGTRSLLADGTEVLGPPSIAITPGGNAVIAAGTGLGGVGALLQSGLIEFTVPPGAAVKQVLLYWEGDISLNLPFGPDPTIEVNGIEITGTLIGGPTVFFSDAQLGNVQFNTFRADVTSLNLVGPGNNLLLVEGLANSYANNGAGVVVIIDDGSAAANIDIRDGQDLAFFNFAPPLNAMVPQTYAFPASASARTATLSMFFASSEGAANLINITIDAGVPTSLPGLLQDGDGPAWDTLVLPITIPAGATSVTVEPVSPSPDGASLCWIAGALVVPQADEPCVFLVIDEDCIDNTTPGFYLTPNTGKGVNGKTFTAKDVNDDRPKLAQRTPLRFFNNPLNFGKQIVLRTGQVGDEGLFAVETIPSSWIQAGPTMDGLLNYLGDPCSTYPHGVGKGLGTGSDPEKRLDKIPNVTPLRAAGLNGLIGKTVCAVVYDSDISINYGPLNGSLKGETVGVVAFKVLEVKKAIGFSSSTLPLITIEILDPCATFGHTPELYDAPAPTSSSTPFDITP